MKICILTPQFPFPEDGGRMLRIDLIARYLKSRGHSLVLVSYYSGDDIEPAKAPYDTIYRVKRSLFISFGMSLWALVLGKPLVAGAYFSFAYLVEFKKAIKKEMPDLYISPFLWMTPYLNLCHLQEKSVVELSGAVFTTDVRGTGGSWIYRLEQKRIAAYVRKTISRYKKCVPVLREDDECF